MLARTEPTSTRPKPSMSTLTYLLTYLLTRPWSYNVSVRDNWTYRSTSANSDNKHGGFITVILMTVHECVGFNVHYRSFWRWVFPVNHLHCYWQPNKNNQQTEHTNNTMQKVALVNSTTDTLKKPRLRERTDRAWFSRHCTTSGQETERVNSYNPEANTRLKC